MKKSNFLRPLPVLAGILAVLAMAGCASQRFYANYQLDPKPPKLAYSDLAPAVNPRPVYLVFDMYTAEGSLPEATRKNGAQVFRVLEGSGLFSSVSKIGSENIARIQVSMRETAVLSGQDTKSMPAGLSTGLSGSRGAIVYNFTATYQAPGQEAVKKIYPHAVHVAENGSTSFGNVFPMTAPHAIESMIQQVMLNFLRDLQKERKL